MDNPFYVTGTVPEQYFCDREQETEKIITLLENQSNVLLTAYRRMGKTQLIYHIFEQQGHGHLVAITSVGGLRGEPMAPAYSASKAYQINYMEALRKKAFKNGGHIIVTDIRPGLVDTSMAKGEGLFWVMPVEKVASQIIEAICKKKSKAYVTRRWHILAIINKNLPFFLYKRI